MLRRRIKSLIGLDIGSRAIKAVELTREGHGFVMTGYGQTEVLSEEQRPDAILEVLREHPFHTKRVVTAVYGKSVIVRYLSMTTSSTSKGMYLSASYRMALRRSSSGMRVMER